MTTKERIELAKVIIEILKLHSKDENSFTEMYIYECKKELEKHTDILFQL